MPYGQIVNPRGPRRGASAGNLPANAATGESVQTAHHACTTARAWRRRSATPSPRTAAERVGRSTSTTTDGTAAGRRRLDTCSTRTARLTTPAAPGLATITPAAATSRAGPGPVTIDLGRLTQFGGANTVAATGAGRLRARLAAVVHARQRRHVIGRLLQRPAQPLGQLALASFNNPGGLEKAGNSSFRVGDNSGDAQSALAGAGGRGVLNSGALEMSNVDLAQEFTSLIVAQRGFQANSRVITASDELLQDLVNLKR